MKKLLVSVIVVMTTAICLSSCKDNKKKVLARTWKVGDIRVSSTIPEEQKPLFDAMLSQMKQYLRVTYKEDGSYNANFLGRNSLGKWQVSEKFDTLSATDETGRLMKYQIITLSKDSFIYKTTEGGEPVTFVMLPGDTLTNQPPVPQGFPTPQEQQQPETTNNTANK